MYSGEVRETMDITARTRKLGGPEMPLCAEQPGNWQTHMDEDLP
jgi:hypothetical protein